MPYEDSDLDLKLIYSFGQILDIADLNIFYLIDWYPYGELSGAFHIRVVPLSVVAPRDR